MNSTKMSEFHRAIIKFIESTFGITLSIIQKRRICRISASNLTIQLDTKPINIMRKEIKWTITQKEAN